ncbi:MAG: hypothetical protein ACLGHL_10030 [Actinomycetota bacterium]
MGRKDRVGHATKKTPKLTIKEKRRAKAAKNHEEHGLLKPQPKTQGS